MLGYLPGVGGSFLAAVWPRIAALAILGIACGGCSAAGDEPPAPELRVEASGGSLTIYVDDPVGDAAAIPVGPGGVSFVCMDADGGALLRRKLKWPFTDTDGGTDIAHGHVGLEVEGSLGRIASCRLTGLESGPLEGSPSIAF